MRIQRKSIVCNISGEYHVCASGHKLAYFSKEENKNSGSHEKKL